MVHGLLLYKTIYDPTVEGGRGNHRFIGQNDVIPLDYGCFFPDPRIGDLLYLQTSRAIILNSVRDLEYFKDRFEGQGKKVMEDNQSADVEIFDSNKDANTYKSKRSNLIEYWYKGKPKMLTAEDKQHFMELAQEALAEGKDPSEHLAKAQGSVKGIHCIYISSSGVFLEHKAYVYDHGQYPIIARALFPVEGTIWPKGYMRDMISPQIMLNKFSELAVETAAKMGNGAMLYEEGALSDTHKSMWKRLRSKVGAMLPVTDIAKVKETQGISINPTHLSMMEYYKDMLQKIPGRFDSANGQASTNVTSGRQAQALQAASAGRLSTTSELIQDALVELFEQYIELIAQFYTTERIGRVTGKPVSISRNQLLSSVQTEFESEEGTLPVVEEYIPKFDISVSVGVEKPSDRDYWIQTAFNLFQTIDPLTGMPMIDIEALEYAIEHGRMEPFDVIKERMQKEQMIKQMVEQLQTQVDQLSQENQIMQQALGQAQQQSEQMTSMRRAEEDDERQFQRQTQMRKLDIEQMKAEGQMMKGMGM